MNCHQSTNLPHTLSKNLLENDQHRSSFKGINEITKLPVTIKIVPKISLNSSQSLTRINREISFLKILNHPLIAKFYETREDEQNYYLIMKFLGNGSLDDIIKKYGNLLKLLLKDILWK
jgi:serine/threonine protein kinase